MSVTHSPQVLARVREPRLVGALPKDAPDVGTGQAGELDSGAWTRISVRVEPRSQRIVQARFKVFGCSAAIASASLVAERLEDATIPEVRGVSVDQVAAALALPDERRHVAALAVEAGRLAIEDWQHKELSGRTLR